MIRSVMTFPGIRGIHIMRTALRANKEIAFSTPIGIEQIPTLLSQTLTGKEKQPQPSLYLETSAGCRWLSCRY